MASTLPSKSSSEKEVHLEDSVHFNQMFDAFGNQLETTSDIINMRNVLLDVILDLLHGSAEGGIDHR